jgi:hypothetical protein
MKSGAPRCHHTMNRLLRLSFLFLALFLLDAQFESLHYLSIDVIESDVNLDMKLGDDAGGHLPDLLVDLHEVEVYDESAFSVLQAHLLELVEHHGDQHVVGLVDLQQVHEDEVDHALEDALGLAVLFLFEDLQDALDQTVDAAEDKEELLVRHVPCVHMQVLEGDREQLADDDEADQILDVVDVQFRYETLHFAIYRCQSRAFTYHSCLHLSGRAGFPSL